MNNKIDERLRKALGRKVCEAMTDREWDEFLVLALKAEARAEGKKSIVIDRLQAAPIFV